MEQEEYVRSRWESVFDSEYGVDIMFDIDTPRQRFAGLNGRWQAAYAFTLERECQIKDVEEEIAWCRYQLSPATRPDGHIRERILARLQSTLADLRKGMK